MAHKPWITGELVTVWCSMSVVSKTVMSWFSHAYECRLCMDLPEANSTTKRDLHCLWAAWPCLSWSAVAVRALISAVFVPWASFTPMLCSGSSPSQARQWTVHIYRMHETTFRLHEIFKCAHFKFTVYGHKQTYIHVHTTSAMQSC